MVIPHGQDKVFSLQLNWYLILFCAAILGMLLFLSGYGFYEGQVRKQEIDRLNRLYGINFKAALQLADKLEDLKTSSWSIGHNMNDTARQIGLGELRFNPEDQYDEARNLAQDQMRNQEKQEHSRSGSSIHFLPPVYMLKTLQYQLGWRSHFLGSLQYWVHEVYSIYRRLPLGRATDLNATVRDSSGYGPRRDPFNRYVLEFHPGYDTRGPVGTAIRATGQGTVYRVMQNAYSGYGRAVLIQHDFGFYSLYAHMSRLHVAVGDKIEKWQLIGEMGNSGRSTGTHLHYEIRYNQESNHIDPLPFICAQDYSSHRCRDYHNNN